MQILQSADILHKGQVYLASRIKDRFDENRSILIRQLLTCASGGTCRHITIDFIVQESSYVKIHPAVGGVQEVCMQLKWREHTLPAFLFISILVSFFIKGSLFTNSPL